VTLMCSAVQYTVLLWQFCHIYMQTVSKILNIISLFTDKQPYLFGFLTPNTVAKFQWITLNGSIKQNFQFPRPVSQKQHKIQTEH